MPVLIVPGGLRGRSEVRGPEGSLSALRHSLAGPDKRTAIDGEFPGFGSQGWRGQVPDDCRAGSHRQRYGRCRPGTEAALARLMALVFELANQGQCQPRAESASRLHAIQSTADADHGHIVRQLRGRVGVRGYGGLDSTFSQPQSAAAVHRHDRVGVVQSRSDRRLADDRSRGASACRDRSAYLRIEFRRTCDRGFVARPAAA